MDSEDLKFREMFPLVLAVVAALTLLFLIAALFVGAGQGEQGYIPSGQTKTDVANRRLEPVGEVAMGGAVVAKADTDSGDDGGSSEPRSGKATYKAVCSSCHANGTLGAPKFGNTGDWKPHAEKPLDKLAHHSLNGYKKMPPQKSAAKLEEIESAVKYMLDEADLEPG